MSSASRVLVRIAATLDERLSARVYDIVVQLPLRARAPGDGSRRCATSTDPLLPCHAPARSRCSICPGCRSTC